MSRFSFTTSFSVAVLLSANICQGQTLVSPAFQKEKPAEVKPEVAPETVLTLHAAAEPDPALRYRFWPSAEDRRNGNPMPLVIRAVLLSVQAVSTQPAAMEFIEGYDKFAEIPTKELPGDEVREFLKKFGGAALPELHTK